MTDTAETPPAAEILSMFGPTHFDDAWLRRPPYAPKRRRTRNLPGTVLPCFVKVGAFWVPDVWRVRQDTLDQARTCAVRRRIIDTVPPIDYESMLELGEFEGYDAERDVHHRVVLGPPPYVYAPETEVIRGPNGEAVFRMVAPAGVLLVPRRSPRPMGSSPDLRDHVEIVCVFHRNGAFHALTLDQCWRFALAWGPATPTLQVLLTAMQAHDAAALTPPDYLVDPVGAAYTRRFGPEITYPLSAADAPEHLAALYEHFRNGTLSVLGVGHNAGTPIPVVRLFPNGGGGWAIELLFEYGPYVVAPYAASASVDNDDKERFIVREFASEDSAVDMLTELLGETSDRSEERRVGKEC